MAAEIKDQGEILQKAHSDAYIYIYIYIREFVHLDFSSVACISYSKLYVKHLLDPGREQLERAPVRGGEDSEHHLTYGQV